MTTTTATRRQATSLSGFFVRDVPCKAPGCTRTVPMLPAGLVDEARCAECQAEERRSKPDPEAVELFERRLRRSNLKVHDVIVRALRLTARAPDPDIRDGADWRRAAEACRELLTLVVDDQGVPVYPTRRVEPARGTLLILSGPPRTGKTTCAAWAAWSTDGELVERAKWLTLAPWGHALRERDWLMQRQGIVVLDEVCPVGSRGSTGDNDIAQSIVNDLASARHARGLTTILTTNATPLEWRAAYGTLAERLDARARWVECL